MQDREHLSDRELVLAADDELGSERARVSSCSLAECKERAANFEGIVAQVAQAHRNSVDSQLPSIARPRAVLRGRISETIAHEASRRAPRRLFAGAFGFAALTMVALASILTMRHLVARDESVPPASTTVSVLPNRNVTPGAVRAASLEQVCAVAQEEVVKDVSPSQRERVLRSTAFLRPSAGTIELAT